MHKKISDTEISDAVNVQVELPVTKHVRYRSPNRGGSERFHIVLVLVLPVYALFNKVDYLPPLELLQQLVVTHSVIILTIGDL